MPINIAKSFDNDGTQFHIQYAAWLCRLSELEKRTYRILNHQDLVPQCLDTLYVHAGTLVRLGQKSGYRIGGPNQPDCLTERNPRRPGAKGPHRSTRKRAMSLPDHSISNYRKKLEAIQKLVA